MRKDSIFDEVLTERLSDKVKFEYPTPHEYKPVLKDVLKNVPDSVGAKYPESKKKVFDLLFF